MSTTIIVLADICGIALITVLGVFAYVVWDATRYMRHLEALQTEMKKRRRAF